MLSILTIISESLIEQVLTCPCLEDPMMTEFSVIVPTYNNASRINATVQSVLRQNFDDFELIIVDDGSTDDTGQVIAEVSTEDKRIKYYKKQNKGVAAARNAGARIARGKFLCFLDSDDKVSETWLKDFYQLGSSGDAGYLSCGYKLYNKDHPPRKIKGISSEKYSSLAGSFAVKKEVFDAIGGYDPVLRQSENFEMTARALEQCQKQNLGIFHTTEPNFIWCHEKSPEQTRRRDEHRANATLYLHEKYSEGGVFHFKKDDFIISSAVNFTRAGKIGEARKIFYRIFRKKPTVTNFLRILVFELPFLRRKKWMRKAVKNE